MCPYMYMNLDGP